MHIRRLTPSDAEAYQSLRLQALRDSPTSFSSSYEEECNRPMGVVAESLAATPERAMFGAFANDHLAGMVGVARETKLKTRHKGFIFAMYVAPSMRGAGAGKRLLGEVLTWAASLGGIRQVTLCVTAGNAAAIALYESMGFVAFGREADALLIDGVFYEDLHMVRHLGGPAKV